MLLCFMHMIYNPWYGSIINIIYSPLIEHSGSSQFLAEHSGSFQLNIQGLSNFFLNDVIINTLRGSLVRFTRHRSVAFRGCLGPREKFLLSNQEPWVQF